ncbi:hypothetical protein ACEWY4_014174 [Coilia grayii]|uniref:Uncharacterized protein n=1 Tax=Coilia grayii TaxID=363190 RepID=A0ABD1JRI6_9TELE
MKSAATTVLCALLVFGYCSSIRGDHQKAGSISAAHPPTTTTQSSTAKRGDGEPITALGTTVAPKPALTPSNTVAPVLDITATKAKEIEKHVANASTDANSNSTGAAHSDPSLPEATNQTGSLAPVPTVTDGSAVTTAGTGANETSKTGSDVAPGGSASQGNQTDASKGPGPKDNSTLPSTTPSPTEAAPATAGPQATTTQPPKAETAPAPSAATTTSPHGPTTAAPIVPHSSASPGHKKNTSKAAATTTTTKGFAATTTTSSSTSTTTTTAVAAKKDTTSPVTAPDHHNGAAMSELNVGDNDNSSKGVSDPLLAGLVSVFVIAAAIVSLLVFLKFRHRNERPEFRRLQDLPMDDMMEDTPLYSY